MVARDKAPPDPSAGEVPSDPLAGPLCELSGERDVLLDIIEHTPEASLAYLDADFNFLFVNSTYATGSGMAKSDLIGRNHFELFPHEENEAIFRRCRDTGEAAEFKARPFSFENQPWLGVTYWDWTLTPLADDAGVVRSLVLSLVDVTEQVKRERFNSALAEIDVVLHSSLDTEEIIRRVIVEATAAAGCESVGVALREGSDWVAYFMGEPLAHLDRMRFTDAQVPVAARAVQRREPVVVDDVEADADMRDALRAFGLKSVLNVPLVVRDEAIGIIGFDYHSAAVPFTQPVIDFATRVAASLSLAISNARVFEAERRKGELEDALNRMLTSFITARHPDDVLREVVEESVRACGAAYSIISFVEEGRWVARHAFGQGGTDRLPVTYAYDERPVLFDVAQSAGMELVEDALTHPRTNKGIMRSFGIGGFAAIPLVMRGEFLGVLELVYATPVKFPPELVRFFERLTSTVSVALEQAREFERDHRVAETLQEAMLVLPSEVTGVEFAHSYSSASDATRVGGDFYDIFELDNGLVGITVGDVSGKGLNAAAVTSLVKNTLRARATEKNTTPAGAVALADRVLYQDSSPEMFATILFAMLDRRDGRLVYCNAGHPPAALVRSDGEACPLSATSPIVGAVLGVAFRDAETRLDPGDLLVLYTDGLTEARRGAEFFGEERLFRALEGAGNKSPAEVVASLRAQVEEFSGARLADDLAILAIRRPDADWGSLTQLKIDTA